MSWDARSILVFHECLFYNAPSPLAGIRGAARKLAESRSLNPYI